MLKWKFSGFNFRNVTGKIEARELFCQSFPNSQSWKTWMLGKFYEKVLFRPGNFYNVYRVF